MTLAIKQPEKEIPFQYPHRDKARLTRVTDPQSGLMGITSVNTLFQQLGNPACTYAISCLPFTSNFLQHYSRAVPAQSAAPEAIAHGYIAVLVVKGNFGHPEQSSLKCLCDRCFD